MKKQDVINLCFKCRNREIIYDIKQHKYISVKCFDENIKRNLEDLNDIPKTCPFFTEKMIFAYNEGEVNDR